MTVVNNFVYVFIIYNVSFFNNLIVFVILLKYRLSLYTPR